MSNVKRVSPSADRQPSGAAPRSEGMLEAVRTLIDKLGPEDRHQILAELTEMLKPVSSPKAGDVLGTLLKFLPRQKDWTVADLKSIVERQGLEASSKEVYNAVGYLTRTGRIRRIGYGRYEVDGIHVVTSDEFGGSRPLPNKTTTIRTIG